MFQQEEGGFYGLDKDGQPNGEVYYMGIIDILQQYNARKWGETIFKSTFTKEGAEGKISSVPPVKYAQRFVEFIRDSTE